MAAVGVLWDLKGMPIVLQQRLMREFPALGSSQWVVMGMDEIHQSTCSADTKKGESA